MHPKMRHARSHRGDRCETSNTGCWHARSASLTEAAHPHPAAYNRRHYERLVTDYGVIQLVSLAPTTAA